MVTKKEVVAKTCYEICKKVLPKYSSKKGPKKYEFWQLIALYRCLMGWGQWSVKESFVLW